MMETELKEKLALLEAGRMKGRAYLEKRHKGTLTNECEFANREGKAFRAQGSGCAKVWTRKETWYLRNATIDLVTREWGT